MASGICCLWPQLLQIWLVYLGSTLSNVRPAFPALLFVIVKKPPQAMSLIAWARWRFLTIHQSKEVLVRSGGSGVCHPDGALVYRPAGTDSLHGGNKMIYKPASISPNFWPRRMALMLCGFMLVSTIFSP